MDDIADVMELFSESVAVASTEENEEMRLEASPVRELIRDEASDWIEESAEVASEVMGFVFDVGSMPMRVVVGSIWALKVSRLEFQPEGGEHAIVTETRLRKRVVQRMLRSAWFLAELFGLILGLI